MKLINLIPLLLLILMLLCFIDRQTVNCIINNGNILTDGKWRCYYEAGRRICYRNEL